MKLEAAATVEIGTGPRGCRNWSMGSSCLYLQQVGLRRFAATAITG